MHVHSWSMQTFVFSQENATLKEETLWRNGAAGPIPFTQSRGRNIEGGTLASFLRRDTKLLRGGTSANAKGILTTSSLKLRYCKQTDHINSQLEQTPL